MDGCETAWSGKTEAAIILTVLIITAYNVQCTYTQYEFHMYMYIWCAWMYMYMYMYVSLLNSSCRLGQPPTHIYMHTSCYQEYCVQVGSVYLGTSAVVLLSCPPSIPKNLLLMELMLRRTERLLISWERDRVEGRERGREGGRGRGRGKQWSTCIMSNVLHNTYM